MKKLATAFITAALLLGGGSASAQVVITGHGIFADCDDAWKYRDGPLLKMLDAAFANYDAEVETRIKDAIAAFEQHRADAEAAYAAANDEQKKRIAFTVGKWLFLETVGKMNVSKLPKSVTDGYSVAQLKVFEQVINTSNNLKVEVAAAIASGNPPDNILTDQAADIALDLLGSYFGPVGAFLTSAGKAGVDVAADYWETQPIIDVAAQEVDIFTAAARKMHGKSKDAKISEINAVKNEIDAACGQ